MIRQPRPNPADDADERILLAWTYTDEAEVRAWTAVADVQTAYVNDKSVGSRRS